MSNKTKFRVIRRTYPCKHTQYVLQRKGFIFGWHDICAGNGTMDWSTDHFPSYKDASENLLYFNGKKPTDEIMSKDEQ